MNVRFLAGFVAALAFSTAANAELNTSTYVSWDGNGDGRVEGDMTGVGPVTLYDGAGGDMWDGGDQFIYLHDENKVVGDFTATARVIGQTESIDGRWGKNGINATANLSGLSQHAMTIVATGTHSQTAVPEAGEHSPVPVRVGGRLNMDGTGGFERPVFDPVTGGEIPNNVFQEIVPNVANPETNVSWLRLQYKAETNTFLSAFAPDVDGVPGAWGYSAPVEDVPLPTADDGEGWYVGLAYSVHNSMDANIGNLADAGGFDGEPQHGVTYDNYSIVNEFLPQELAVGGTAIGALTIAGEGSGLAFGDPEVVSGLSQYWFAGNMRPGNGDASGPEEYIAVGTTGNEAHPLINPTGRAIVTDTTWWRGGQGNPVTNAELPSYPAEIAGSAGWTGDNYGVKLVGEIFIPEDGEYIIRDGIDDFAMIAIDVDGNGELDALNDLATTDVGTIGGASLDDVHVLDDDWANADGGSQAPEFHGFAEFENISADGDWRKIEVWMGEGGGGDAGVLYMGDLADPDIFSEVDEVLDAPLSPEARDAYLVKQENLRTTITPVIGGASAATLDGDVHYIVQANADGSDQIIVDDADGTLVTSLDVSGATIVIRADGVAEGTAISLFDADSLTGTDTLNLVFDDASQWDVSDLANGVITFGAGGGPVCDATTSGDINGDGSVGFPDFLILSANFGSAVTGAGHLEGDLDCDGSVAFADFLVLSNAFGTTVGAEAANVPEPSGITLLGVAAFLGGLIRRRRR